MITNKKNILIPYDKKKFAFFIFYNCFLWSNISTRKQNPETELTFFTVNKVNKKSQPTTKKTKTLLNV